MIVDDLFNESQLTELSNIKLAQYKKAAGADASVADQAGNTKKADKRFSGIVKATKKQFANDKKGLTEDLQADDGEYYSNSDKFFGQFEADHFDNEETSPDGMEVRGYIDGVCVMAWRFKSAKKVGGWGIYDDSALQGIAEDNLKEFAPGGGGGESGRWYTDDQITDIVGDGWYNDLDVSGDIPKQQMIQEAQAWLDDQGYSVQVLNCKVNDDDMEWYIEGSFQNSGFAKKGMAEGKADYNFDAEDLKRLERIRDLPTLKAQALALIAKPSAKPMKPEKVEWFKNALENMNSPLKVIKLMYDLLLSGEGNSVIGTKSSMNPNSYRQRFSENDMEEGQTADMRAFFAGADSDKTLKHAHKSTVVPPKQNDIQLILQKYRKYGADSLNQADFEKLRLYKLGKTLYEKPTTKEGVLGTVGGAAAGMALGGPLGAAIGAVGGQELTSGGSSLIELDKTGEYDQEGSMAQQDLTTASDAAAELRSILSADENLPEWVQAKITKAVDYLDTARDYMKSEKHSVSEDVSARMLSRMQSVNARLTNKIGQIK